MVEISCDIFFCLVLVISFYLVLFFINLYVKMNILFVSVILFRYIGMAASYIFIFSLLLFFSFVLLLGGWHGFLVGCFILS
jgi:hypothetical protein